MSNLSHTQLQRQPKAVQHEASRFTLAVVMAGIFAFFVAGIASAFIYAKDANPVRSAAAPAPPASTGTPAETTGSGVK